MNLDELLKIPDPANPARPAKTEPQPLPQPQPSPASPVVAMAAPGNGVLPMQVPPADSIPPSPVASAPPSQHQTQRSNPASARKGDVVIDKVEGTGGSTSAPSSRPPSASVPTGSARAAAISLKNSAPATSVVGEAPPRDVVIEKGEQPRRKNSDSGSAAFDIDKLSSAIKVLDQEERTAPKRAKSGSVPVSINTNSQDLPSNLGLSPKTATTAVEPTSAVVNKPTIQVTEPQPSPAKTLEASASNATVKSETNHTPTHAEQTGTEEHHNMHRVPKFRRKSGEGGDLEPSLGKGAEGPKDPDAIDKIVEIKMEIIDSDQLSPRAEAVVRTKKDNKIVLALLNVKFRYQHDHVRRISTYQVLGLKLHGFSNDLLQNRFDPYLKLSYGNGKWSCITSSVKSTGQVAEWAFDPEHGFFDKLFKVTDDELAVEANSMFTCVVKKKNAKGNEDFESGSGAVMFTHELFKGM